MCCRAAVERAFTELVSRDVPEAHARETGLRIYRFHHPDVPLLEAVATVSAWTRPARLH